MADNSWDKLDRFFTSELRGIGWGLVGLLAGASALLAVHALPLLAIGLAGVAVFSGYKWRKAAHDYWAPYADALYRINHGQAKERTGEREITPAPPQPSTSFTSPAGALSDSKSEAKWRDQFAAEKTKAGQGQNPGKI